MTIRLTLQADLLLVYKKILFYILSTTAISVNDYEKYIVALLNVVEWMYNLVA